VSTYSGVAVGAKLGLLLGLADGVWVGDKLGKGDTVGLELGFLDGLDVGLRVGEAVGVLVLGEKVGDIVLGEKVGYDVDCSNEGVAEG